MSMIPANDENDTERESDRQADAMKTQLRKDVASWSAARSETSVRDVAEFSVPVVKQPASRSVTHAKKSKPATKAVPPAVTGKKPFSMSYDGVTTAEHIQYMIARGTR